MILIKVLNRSLIKRFIMQVIREEMDSNPRFATQLMSPNDAKASKQGNQDKKLNDDGDEYVDEFCSVGGGSIAGHSATLGDRHDIKRHR